MLGVFVAFRYHDAAPNMVDTALWPILSVAFVSKAWFDRLPPDLKKIVLETGSKIEPELLKWQIARIDVDTKAWTDKGGKITKLSDQDEAVRRTSAAAQAVVAKRSAQGVLRQAQGHHRVGELRRGRAARQALPNDVPTWLPAPHSAASGSGRTHHGCKA